MILYHLLDNYYQQLTQAKTAQPDPRLSSYFLAISDLPVLIQHDIQNAIAHHHIPSVHVRVESMQQQNMAFILLTLGGGLENFPVYHPRVIKNWCKKGLPKQFDYIDTAWYSDEFQCLEKILFYFAEKYNYEQDSQQQSSKRYWTMLEIEESYEQQLMHLAIQNDGLKA